jgi:hypothetical protein
LNLRSKNYLSPKCSDWLWGPLRILEDPSMGVKWPVSEADHSAISSAEVQNEWSCTSIPHICLPTVYKDNFTFFPKIRVKIIPLSNGMLYPVGHPTGYGIPFDNGIF